MTQKRTSIHQGREAEHQSRRYLEHQGLQFLERNYRCRLGEIDLIMDDHGTVVFVEVRYRGSSRFGCPAETVDARKQARLRATAEHFLQRRRQHREQPCRFDVIAISGNRQPPVWLKDAF
jgi:putative endonuclease